MGIGCGANVIKYVLFAFNFIWLGLGAAILYFGVIVLTKFTTDISQVIEQSPSNAAIILLAAGGLIFMIAFFGCCGAIKESFWMLNTYSIIIFVLLVAQAFGAYLVLRYQTDLKQYATDGIRAAMNAYHWHKSAEDPANRAINEFQKQLLCCGAENHSDWDEIVFKEDPQEKGRLYPPSCCKDEKDADVHGKCPAGKTNRLGCVEAMEELMTTSLGGLGFVALAIVLIQLLILISSCCLAREYRRYNAYSAPKN